VFVKYRVLFCGGMHLQVSAGAMRAFYLAKRALGCPLDPSALGEESE
jgi:hypothetical protein